MTVKFKGAVTGVRKGCGVCGQRRVSKNGFQTIASFYLPSGGKKTFVIGKPVEVSDSDGLFLLRERDIADNYVFEEM